jgi:hypothetical protein
MRKNEIAIAQGYLACRYKILIEQRIWKERRWERKKEKEERKKRGGRKGRGLFGK